MKKAITLVLMISVLAGASPQYGGNNRQSQPQQNFRDGGQSQQYSSGGQPQQQQQYQGGGQPQQQHQGGGQPQQQQQYQGGGQPQQQQQYQGGGQSRQEPSAPAQYEFQYDVNDDQSGNFFGHRENRNGARTEGRYYVRLPDTRLMTVEYYADETGYHPTITFEGEAQFPEQPSGNNQYQQPQQRQQQPTNQYQQPQQQQSQQIQPSNDYQQQPSNQQPISPPSQQYGQPFGK